MHAIKIPCYTCIYSCNTFSTRHNLSFIHTYCSSSSSPAVPARVFVEDMVEVSTQLLGRVSYFQYELPEEGMTLRLNVAAGRVVLYASTRIPNPNSALYDIRIETDSTEDVFVRPEDLLRSGGVGRRKRLEGGHGGNSTGTMIYVSIEGLRGNNSYILETTFGDTSTCKLNIILGEMILALMARGRDPTVYT